MSKSSVLLLVHGSHGHTAGDAIAEIVSSDSGFEVSIQNDYSELTRDGLAKYDAVVNYSGYSARVEPTEAQLRDLIGAVDGGKAYLALHPAALMFRNQLFYRKPIGAPALPIDAPALVDRIRSEPDEEAGNGLLSGDPVLTHRVCFTNPRHPITAGLDDFEISDQVYELRGDMSRTTVLANIGRSPVLHVSRWGAGRVHYNGLGHDLSAVQHPIYRSLVRRALSWAVE